MGWLVALGPLIPVLVTQVEKLFGKGKGSTKLNTVLNAVTPVLSNLVNAKALGGAMPPQADIIAEINAVAAKLFPAGTTYSTATDPLVTNQTATPIAAPIQGGIDIPQPPVPASPLGQVGALAPSLFSLSSDQKLQLMKVVLSL